MAQRIEPPDSLDDFGIAAAPAVNFALNDPNTKVRQKCYEVITAIEDKLDASTYGHIHSMVGKDFWLELIEHTSVKETYLNTVQAAELRGDPSVSRFEFGGITWERYRTGSKAEEDVGAPFIGAKQAQFFPVGVPDLFLTRFAPADYLETVNTIGLPRYSRQFEMPNGKGVNLEVQANSINLCTRPAALRQGTTP